MSEPSLPHEGLHPWYVTGLVESAGAFTFSRTDRNLSLYFSLKIRDPEGTILKSVQMYFGGAGRIYGSSVGSDPMATKTSHYYRVSRLDELERVIEHFDTRPLRGRKAASYLLWRQMVVLKRDTFRKPHRERLSELCAALSSTSSRRGRGRSNSQN